MADSKKLEIKIMRCDCKHDYQDLKYGLGMRVHNPGQGKSITFKCTVCGKKK